MDKMIEREIKNLSKKHNLSSLEIMRLRTEAIILRLRIDYAVHMLDSSFFDTLVKYAGILRLMRGQSQEFIESLKKELDKQKITVKYLDALTRRIFIVSYRTKDICKHKKYDSCFSYSIENNDRANIHFVNAVIPKNPLSGNEIKARKNELKAIAKDIKENHPEIKYLFGISWMRNLKTYRDFFPKETKHKKWTPKDNYSLEQFGQFYRYDGTPNFKRIEEFRSNWKFPMSTIIGKSNIKPFLKMYLYPKN